MTEPTNNSGSWQLPKLSVAPTLAVALSLSLLFSAYLLIRLNERSQNSSQTAPLSTPDSGAVVTSGQGNAQAPGSAAYDAADLDALMAQLADTQSRLQVLSGQLDQKGQVLGYSTTGSSNQNPMAYEDVNALWAEIEQLNQIMQPLMAQVDAAYASSSSRSPSELIALRTQVNTIHQRLAYLLERVEAAKAQPNSPYNQGSWSGGSQWGTSAGSWTNPGSAEQVMLQQLYQNMTEMNSMLQQLQGQGTAP